MKCVLRCKDCKKRLSKEEDKKKPNSKEGKLEKLKGGKKKKRHNNKQVSFKTKSGKVVSFTRKN